MPTGPVRPTAKPRQTLSHADLREMARLLGGVLDRIHDGTLDPAGAFGVVRRMEGAKTVLEAILTPVPARKTARRPRK